MLLGQHGTPGSGRLFRAEVEGAERLGARLVAYSRPGYGGSTPQPGRSVADAAADVAALLDALGAERFATYGGRAAGRTRSPAPRCCPSAARPRRRSPASPPATGPISSSGRDGRGNVEEFGAAFEGRERLSRCRGEAAGLLLGPPEQLAEALAPHLSASTPPR